VEDLIATELRDTINTRILLSSGSYWPPARVANAKPFSAHAHFMAAATQRAGV
jgi:hypothetical protein